MNSSFGTRGPTAGYWSIAGEKEGFLTGRRRERDQTLCARAGERLMMRGRKMVFGGGGAEILYDVGIFLEIRLEAYW